MAAKLEQGRESALLSKELATAAFDAPVEATLADLKWKGTDRAKVEALFDRLGMTGLRGRVLEL